MIKIKGIMDFLGENAIGVLTFSAVFLIVLNVFMGDSFKDFILSIMSGILG